MQEKIIAARDCSKHNLSPFFFHLVVRAFAQRSEECRHLWQDLQTSKAELAALALVDDEKKVSCQQTLELQNALMASHSDLDCQRMMESWANSLTEFKIKVNVYLNFVLFHHCPLFSVLCFFISLYYYEL